MRFVTVFIFLVVSAVPTLSQSIWSENFEGTDSIPPPGWGVWNQAPFPILPEENWVVRDSGLALPGLATATSVAHSGTKSAGVSWLSGTDSTGAFLQADAWLITRMVTGIQNGDSLIFWGSGGSTNWDDSIQIWFSITDSLPENQQLQLASVYWPVGSTYGQFQRYAFDLSVLAGADIWIGFRYNVDVANSGFFVFLDDVSVGNSTVSVQQDGFELPAQFRLEQNYPNPFNPSTNIRYSIPERTFVTLQVYDMLGRKVATLVNEQQAAGTYRADFNASTLANGAYMYSLHAGEYSSVKKMVVLK
ncbi:MAG TPA: choice-of-anchor J domain-containing protein [Bacteroidota bacterium]|jgi:hypothetical protein